MQACLDFGGCDMGAGQAQIQVLSLPPEEFGQKKSYPKGRPLRHLILILYGRSYGSRGPFKKQAHVGGDGMELQDGQAGFHKITRKKGQVADRPSE